MDTDGEGTFDYIWYKGPNFAPVNAVVAGKNASPTDNTIYGSDHMAVYADFSFDA
jgi:endonuclease/exonuclease/phosphatase (EEP) superfamily protein YafD